MNARRVSRRILVIALALLCVVYAFDYVSLRYRIPNHREPFGSVKMQSYYAVPRKDGRTEYFTDEPRTEPCVHSLFPHYGENPCWYMSRRTNRRINM
jgi:hypothetical protein